MSKQVVARHRYAREKRAHIRSRQPSPRTARRRAARRAKLSWRFYAQGIGGNDLARSECARLVAIGLVLALVIFVAGGAMLIIFGDALAAALAGGFGLGEVFTAVWPLVIGIGMIYHSAPNVERNWRRHAPGAVFAVGAMAVASFLFSIYLGYAPSYSATYGSLGAVIVLMLWLYILGLAIFLGGEINSEIGKAAGRRFRRRERKTR